MSKELKSVLIYTRGDFPYGMAPESLVRQMALGLKFHNVKLKVIRLRGQSYNYDNDTSIEVSNFMLPRVPNTEIAKFIELICTIFLVPFSIIRNNIKNRPDAVILYGVEYFYLIFPFWLACKLSRIKLIRITTDFYRESAITPVWWKKPKLFFYRFQFKHFDKYLDGIVSLSRYMSEFALKNGVNPEKITIIPHFIDSEEFCKGIIANQQSDKTRIGFCGTANELNGIYDLIEAFKIVHAGHPKIELLIIGEPNPGDKIKINNMIAPFGDTVKITGLLSRSEVPAALMSCHILVNPRKSGLFAEAGFPTKLGEYFSTGIPVVATCVGDIKSYFKDKHELMLVNPDQPDEIAYSIGFLIKNTNEATQIGIRGKEWAKSNLDYKANTAKLLKFVQLI